MEAIYGLIGVLLGAFLTAINEILKEKREKKKKAEFLAIRLTIIFEDFIQSCVEVVNDDGSMGGPSNDGCKYISAKAPEINFQTLDVEWQCLPFDLLYEILHFPALLKEANRKISEEFDISGAPDYEEGFEARQYQFSRLGLLAVQISKKLRSEFKMPEKHYEDFDPIEFLQDNKKKIDEKRIKQEKNTKNYQYNLPNNSLNTEIDRY